MPDDRLQRTRDAYLPKPPCRCAQLMADASELKPGEAATCPEHPTLTVRRGPVGAMYT